MSSKRKVLKLEKQPGVTGKMTVDKEVTEELSEECSQNSEMSPEGSH